MPSLVIRLNGTDTNPFHRMGLTQNPFGQLGRAETDAFERQIAKLGAEPIPPARAEAHIRQVLAGFSEEFIAGCIERYQPGKVVAFEITFPRILAHARGRRLSRRTPRSAGATRPQPFRNRPLVIRAVHLALEATTIPMHLRPSAPMPIALLLAGALLMGAAIPAAAQGTGTVYVQCAIEAYSTGVILTANSINNANLIRGDAAACTNLIATGEWFGVDKYGSWRELGYVDACTITIDRVQTIDVYAIYGDYTSAFAAIASCREAESKGNPVRYIGE